MRKRAALAASSLGVAALAVMAWAGVSAAVSGGGYDPGQNDCPANASAWDTSPDSVPPGCHNFEVNVESGGTSNGDPSPGNVRYAELGLDQLPNDPNNPSFGFEENVGDPGTPDSPHSGCVGANTAGTGGGTGTGCGNNPDGTGFETSWDYYFLYCPVAAALPVASTPDAVGTATAGKLSGPALYQCYDNSPAAPDPQVDTNPNAATDAIVADGLLVYIGATDNLDNGEHDGFNGANGTSEAVNGSSDGGGVVASVTPFGTNLPSFAHPEGIANVSEGECADSICFEGTTQQQSVYQGGGTGSTNAYYNDTPASTEESPDCNGGGSDTVDPCYTNQDGSPNSGGANTYYDSTGTVYAEPGIQTYQDPDPNRSPALPVATPGLYAGTCGVYANDSGGDGNPGITGQNLGYVGGVSNC